MEKIQHPEEYDQAEREVVILLSDMVGYSTVTYDFTPTQLRDFIVEYHQKLHALLFVDKNFPVTIDPIAGDGAIIIFNRADGESRQELCTRALQAATGIVYAAEAQQVQQTRIGLFLGKIIEAKLGYRTHKFGSSFAVASRLESLCGFFGTSLLMDREIARAQLSDQEYILSIGKVTPKNFTSPFNLFTLFKPGINGCPKTLTGKALRSFICQKNAAMELFCGNQLTGEKPDFPAVRVQLREAQELFVETTGRRNLATDRILWYIRERPFHDLHFEKTGIQLDSKRGPEFGSGTLNHLSRQILKALDADLYRLLVENTDWEEYFKLEWRQAGEIIFETNSAPDGIYYIDQGAAEAVDENGEILAVFEEGSIFGEMAYFSEERKRTATVRAASDLVLRRISVEDFEKLPEIQKILRRLAETRQSTDITAAMSGSEPPLGRRIR